MKYKVLKDYEIDGGIKRKGEILLGSSNFWFNEFLIKEGYLEPVPEKKGGRIWIPEKNEKYYAVENNMGAAFALFWDGGRFEDMLLAKGSFFKTPLEAEHYIQKLEALAKIKHYIADNFEPWEPDWKDEGELKFYICFNHSNNEFDCHWYDRSQRVSLLPYFRTVEETREIINKFERELRIIFGVRKE
jgi:hypothetical protein